MAAHEDQEGIEGGETRLETEQEQIRFPGDCRRNPEDS